MSSKSTFIKIFILLIPVGILIPGLKGYANAQAKITVELPDTTTEPGQTIVIPIRVNENTPLTVSHQVIAVLCEVNWDTSALLMECLDVVPGDMVPPGYIHSKNIYPDRFLIQIAGTSPPITGYGNLLLVTFKVDASASPGDSTRLHFEEILFNEGEPEAEARDGSVQIPPSFGIITPSPLPDGYRGIAYTLTLHAVAGVPPYTWSIESGTLPPGLSLDPGSGEIGGTPTTVGPYNFTIKVTDSGGDAEATKTFDLTIFEALVITTPSPLPDGYVGAAYSQIMEATGGRIPYTWSIESGALPPGMNLDSGSGEISGTPTSDGTYNFTVKVIDSGGDGIATKPFNLTIHPGLTIITPSPLPGGYVGGAYSDTLQATGGLPPYTWSIESGDLPPGLSLNSDTGEISGTPTTAGTYNFTIKVNDSGGEATATKAFDLTIYEGLTIITPSPLPNGYLGLAYSQTLQAIGGVLPYTWSLESGTLPPGLDLDSGSGEISGTPTTVGAYNFIVNVADSGGSEATATKEFDLTIKGLVDTVSIAIPDTIITPGDTFKLPVKITSDPPPAGASNQVLSAQMEIAWNPSVIEFKDANLDTIVPSGWQLNTQLFSGPTEDTLSIWMAGTNPIIDQGIMIKIKYVAMGTPPDSTPVRFLSMIFNEGMPGADTTNGSVKIAYCVPPVANFKANPTAGVAPLIVQFTDLSGGDITGWKWYFGDGDSSTEQHPKHVYDPRLDPKFTVTLIVTGCDIADTLTRVDYITVYLPVQVDFDAQPTVGLAPLTVNFQNLTTGSADNYQWTFGDGGTSTTKDPVYVYKEPGSYDVFLQATGPGGKDCVNRKKFIIAYADSGYLGLSFVEGSPAYSEEPWENAIDADTWGWTGTATVEGEPAWAIFKFQDQRTKVINRIRLMTDTGVYFKDRWTNHFTVQVSTTGTLPSDFKTVLDTVKQNGKWETFYIAPDNAKYVKLIINEPAAGWRQVGEFEVWENITLPDPRLSTIVATSPHYANGVDSSTITLALKDKHGTPITGKAAKIKLYVSGSDNMLSKLIETGSSGVYEATLTTMTPAVKTIWAKVHGVEIRYTAAGGHVRCTAVFRRPPLILSTLILMESSPAFSGEGWDNAIDGDIKGWDGTVTATGYPPYAIFKFADDRIHSIHRIRMMTNSGVGHSERWVSQFRVLVSTTGTDEADFTKIIKGHQVTGNWQDYYFIMTDAKYVKLAIDEPNTTWRQLGEFEVYELASSGGAGYALNKSAASNGENLSPVPDQFSLLQNYPNPFNPETAIQFEIPEKASVVLSVYNVVGQKICTLLNAEKEAGTYRITWDGKNDLGVKVSSGVYFYVIRANANEHKFIHKKKMTLIR